MQFGLKERTAVTTRGSKGIGKNIARARRAEGVNAAFPARNTEPLEDAAKEIR